MAVKTISNVSTLSAANKDTKICRPHVPSSLNQIKAQVSRAVRTPLQAELFLHQVKLRHKETQIQVKKKISAAEN